MNTNRYKTELAIPATIGLVLMLAAGCERRQETAEHTVSSRDFETGGTRDESVRECWGTLHPTNTFTVRLNAGESVDSIPVRLEDTVKQGDVLAVLINPALQEELVAARERILALRREDVEISALQWKASAAAARLAELSQRLKEQEALRGKITGYDPHTQDRELIDEKNRVEREMKGYENDLQQRAKLNGPVVELIASHEQRIVEIERRLARLTVRAPHAGVVVRLEREPLPKDGLLLELHDRTSFVVRGALWQNQLENVNPGCSVEVIPDYSSKKQWKGSVVSIGLAPVVNAVATFPQYSLDVALDDYDNAQMLRDGMTVMLRICLDGGGR